MNCQQESSDQRGLYILDSLSDEEFQNVVKTFSILLEIDRKLKDVQGDSNSEEVPLETKLK